MELMDSTVAGKCKAQPQRGKQPQIRDCKKEKTQTREKTNTKAKVFFFSFSLLVLNFIFSLAALLKGTNKVIYLSICVSIYLSIDLPSYFLHFFFLLVFHFSFFRRVLHFPAAVDSPFQCHFYLYRWDVFLYSLFCISISTVELFSGQHCFHSCDMASRALKPQFTDSKNTWRALAVLPQSSWTQSSEQT